MSQYLELTDSDYVTSGNELTLQSIIRASSIIDGYCKRSISVTSYTERVPLTEYQRGHLSYYPVLEVTELKGRPKHGMIGNNFFGPPQFEAIDISTLDVDKNTGSLWCGYSAFGTPYMELEVTYISGWNPIPDEVKVACGMVINQLTSNSDNVKSKKDFDYTIEYFGNSLITPDVAAILSKYTLISFR